MPPIESPNQKSHRSSQCLVERLDSLPTTLFFFAVLLFRASLLPSALARLLPPPLPWLPLTRAAAEAFEDRLALGLEPEATAIDDVAEED
mmetsp:Transcript_19872/g.60272  ORF Transcript_19872/g.60272 Transcript_19872/m.60272 type:complete len:90 (-) Transcript_19872:2930-3199(-)